ncbi:MAG: hypothetical protein RIQ60_1703 [Pseudomonadota bacterium]|jgi:ribulose-5-phosphate 4-epimerase/fuculose-1-phosphate aldolase/enamine deaminase RidA (YjgF/YER057c/UK114 family)
MPASPSPRTLISSGSSFEAEIGYSRAVVQGDWVFVSGTTGFDYASMTIVEGIEAQTEQCLRNIAAALAQAGATMADVVRVTYVLPDGGEFARTWPVLQRWFGDVRPAAMMISVGLADPRMKIEIEVTALKAARTASGDGVAVAGSGAGAGLGAAAAAPPGAVSGTSAASSMTPPATGPTVLADAQASWASPAVTRLREDLALALRAAAHHGLAEGVCNHFSVELPDGSGRFLLNPRGLLWQEIRADDIVMVDRDGAVLAGRHPVEPTAMFIHAAVHRLVGVACVMHTHMPHATALTLTAGRALDTTLSQNAMRFHGRVAVDEAYNGLALDVAEGERIARAMAGRDVLFLANHGVVVGAAQIAHAWDDLYYLERACLHEVLAAGSGRPLVPVNADLAAHVGRQIAGERLQSDLFFEALRRTLP